MEIAVGRKQCENTIVGPFSIPSPHQHTANTIKWDIAHYQPWPALCFVCTNSRIAPGPSSSDGHHKSRSDPRPAPQSTRRSPRATYIVAVCVIGCGVKGGGVLAGAHVGVRSGAASDGPCATGGRVQGRGTDWGHPHPSVPRAEAGQGPTPFRECLGHGRGGRAVPCSPKRPLQISR